MRFRSGTILVIAFSSLILLIAVSALFSFRKARDLYTALSELNRSHQRTERILQAIRSDMHVSSLLVRDYLLDPNVQEGTLYRERLRRDQNEAFKRLDSLSAVLKGKNADQVHRLREEVIAYWQALAPAFGWTQAEKQSRSYWFLRREVIPRREAVFEIAEELENFNETNLRAQEEEAARSLEAFDLFLLRMTAVAILVGIIVAAGTVWRVVQLERIATTQHRRTEEAEEKMRQLSHQLVEAQEQERRAISRELHDEVGQMLTGLRMDLANLQRLHLSSPELFEERLNASRAMLEQTLRSVRDLAMGLRPSMLDDLGLRPALEWQAREFSRRFDIPVTVEADASIDDLPEAHRTAVYRVVQEALTNCARHAAASSITICLEELNGKLHLVVEDNGMGMAPDARGKGLGLLGMQERIRGLDGTMTIVSSPETGTKLEAEIPLVPERQHA
jgi:signal transduction histidine kinase